MKVWSELKKGNDGLLYSVRYLLDGDELRGLLGAGIVGRVDEVIGMQQVADSIVAGYEKQAFTACGGQIQ